MIIERRRYVGYLLFTPAISISELKVATIPVEESIVLQGGEVESVHDLGAKPISYKIKKQSSAFYKQIYFSLEDTADIGGKLKELSRKMRLNQTIIRFMILKANHKEVFNKKIQEYAGYKLEI